MFSVDKPFIKKLFEKHRNFLFKCYSTKNFHAKKALLKKATLFQLNVLLRCFFLLVHHHIELRKSIGTVTKKFLLRHFKEKQDYQQLMHSSEDNKRIVLNKLVSSFQKLLSPLFDNYE